MGAFASGLAAAGLLEEALGRDPREHDSLDLATLAAATFKASRTITRDEVTSLIREPFTEGRRTRARTSRSTPATFASMWESSSRAAAAAERGSRRDSPPRRSSPRASAAC
jgi:hypothetical protein